MPLYPKPHSQEWFEALEKFNPMQAAIVKQVVATIGRLDVCSICGDNPAKDYKLIAKGLPEDAVATIRLCDDCLNMREHMYKEKYDLL